MNTEVSLVPASEGSSPAGLVALGGRQERGPGPIPTCSQGKGWEPRPIPNLAMALSSFGNTCEASHLCSGEDP